MNENLVHVKIEYNEALQAKKDLLSLEMNLVKTIRDIKKYKHLRLEDLRLRNKLKRKTGPLVIELRKIQKNLPKIRIHFPKKDEQVDEISKKIENIKKTKNRDLIEKEIEEIQDKLRVLQLD